MTAQQQEFTRIDSDFRSHGIRCAAWLYLPKGVTSPPIVIMAHGFAAERTFRLPAFAERFAGEGMAVFLFDYRCFGDSDGKPRNLVNPFRHVQDWKAAIAHVRALPTIDHNRIALWGASYSGGHVMMVASQDPDISAIVCQLPFLDPLPAVASKGMMETAKGFMAGCRDLFRIATFRSPYCLPVAGDPGTVACLNTPDAKPGYFSLIPEGSKWKNECPARVMFVLGLYRPIATAGKVKCPALIIKGEKDSLHPPAPIEKAASTMSRAEFIKLPVGPFDPYAGEWFEKTVELETRFLKKHLIEGR